MDDPERNACAGCAHGSTRREFVRQATLAAGMLAALGLDAARAAALPLRATTGRPSHGGVTYPIPTADGALIDEANQVILVRWRNAVYGFSLSCPHQRTALRWDAQGAQFRCPKHKSRFEPNGALVDGKAKRAMDRFAVSRAGSDVIVDTERMYREPDDPAAWRAAFVTLEGGGNA